MVLVAASPCRAGDRAVPVTVVSAIGAASKLVWSTRVRGRGAERFGGIRHLAVDKTGTLTRNEPTVTRVVTTGATENEVLAWAASLEGHSTHPLAAAITKAVPGAPTARTTSPRPPGAASPARSVVPVSIAVGSPRWLDAGTLADQVQVMESGG